MIITVAYHLLHKYMEHWVFSLAPFTIVSMFTNIFSSYWLYDSIANEYSDFQIVVALNAAV